MFAEDECLNDSDNVFLIFRVVLLQFFQYACLDQSLLIQALLVTKDLQSYNLLLLMIKDLEYLTERAFADSLLYLESVGNVIVNIADVFSFIVVKAAILGTIGRCQRLPTVLSFKNI